MAADRRIPGKRGVIIAALALAALQACKTLEWVNRERADANFSADRFDCDKQAAAAYPPNVVQTQQYDYLSSAAQSYNHAARQPSCPPGAVACASVSQAPTPVYTTRTRDENELDRLDFWKSCMSAHGWRRE